MLQGVKNIVRSGWVATAVSAAFSTGVRMSTPYATDLDLSTSTARKSLRKRAAEERIKRQPYAIHKAGPMVLFDPLTNKGTGFPFAERERLNIRGLVPPAYFPPEAQMERILRSYHAIDPANAIEKYNFLSALQDRNEVLFYRILSENITEMAPIVYTPTVGEACTQFNSIFRRPRGMFFSAKDRYEMSAMVYNWPHSVDVIVVTDGSRILGLGDLGVGGMGIPIGKLALYVAAGGIHPARTMPAILDVGTNNEALLADPLYLGLRQPRLTGEDYDSLMDELMTALKFRFPEALIQFEDFSNENAARILSKYRDTHLCFNDDIQGTGAVALAGVLSAIRKQGYAPHHLPNLRIAVLGAGSAGLGVVQSLINGMIEEGATPEQAHSAFYLVDVDGLLGAERKKLSPLQKPLARTDLPDGMPMLDVVRKVKPDVLLGLSGVSGGFTEEIVKAMANSVQHPIIFPMSNPSSNTECTPAQAIEWTDGRALVATGSPFEVTTYKGKRFATSQCNNYVAFPGLGFGAIAAKASKVTDGMLYATARAIADCVTDADLEAGKLFPDPDELRETSALVATAVIKQALAEGIAQRPGLEGLSDGDIHSLVLSKMWEPAYVTLVEDARAAKHR
ncbi:malic enzyme [Thecamonas trahens ATCC 50062]|uniref:Malic enzyme n=1 Tax=Thecamonas trahens ATCC 50062 TaxID=461836 RepID=A0A0L0D1U7_THETB|nr:malic enzyme [Thecamonas trahens ATCC 50062]KNC46181.1 malic enzyme [Thecamonas trahens ATCC 50062]|eukprot:XP_013763156.1 malic enzyme [Thecamonas trahens ATCC 50062]